MHREDQTNTLRKFFGFVGLGSFMGRDELEPNHTEPNFGELEGIEGVPHQLAVMPSEVPPVMRVTEALTAATTQFVRSHVAPVIAADRGGLGYTLHAITIQTTPQTAGALAEFRRLPVSVKSRLTLNAIEKAAGSGALVLDQFFGLDISDESGDLAGTVIEVMASGGRAKPFSFLFSGEFVARGETEFSNSRAFVNAGDRVGGATPLRFQSGPVLKLVVHDHKSDHGRAIEVSRFPARIGAGKDVEVRVEGKYVSALHAQIDYNGSAFTVTDMSKNGTWLDRTGRLQQGQSRTLPQNGYFFLSVPPDAGDADSAPRIAFSGSGGALRQTVSTSMAPKSQFGGDTPIGSAGPGDGASGPVTPMALSSTALNRSSEQAEPSLGQGTATTPVVAPRPRPLARIRITERGKEDRVVDVSEIPFCIGREPENNGAAVPALAQNVSRRHLRLIQPYGGSAMLVENLGAQRNGTFIGREEQPARFRWKTGETLSLGGRSGDPQTIQVRLETA